MVEAESIKCSRVFAGTVFSFNQMRGKRKKNANDDDGKGKRVKVALRMWVAAADSYLERGGFVMCRFHTAVLRDLFLCVLRLLIVIPNSVRGEKIDPAARLFFLYSTNVCVCVCVRRGTSLVLL